MALTLTVVPNVPGYFSESPTIVRYSQSRSGPKFARLIARGPLVVITEEENLKRQISHRREWFIYSALSLLLILVPIALYMHLRRKIERKM